MHRHCLTDWPTDSGLFLHRMQYLKSRKQMRESRRKEGQKERVQVRQQSKVLQSLEEENQLMRHVFRWRSRSTQIASGVKGLSMGTWTDCGYLRGSWAAVGLNPRRESPSGWGPFVETVCLVPAVALTGCVGSSGRSKLGLALTGVVPDVPRRLCLGNAMGLTTTRRGISRPVSDKGEHLLAK